MRSRVFLWAAFTTLAAACGNEIGDECVVNSDCSNAGDRQCVDQGARGGYCTVQGCDLGTCPEEATCVRFFTGSFENRPCDPATEDRGTDDCSLDEVCPVEGQCSPRSSEIRYCMLVCGSSDDCREGYECRDLELMRVNGGEPVLAPGVPVDNQSPKFCAPAAADP